jgi:hypothetical protein
LTLDPVGRPTFLLFGTTGHLRATAATTRRT